MGGGCSKPLLNPFPINSPNGTRTTIDGESPAPGGCPTRLPNVPDSPIGVPIKIAGSCSTTPPLVALCPQNGEWQAQSTDFGCCSRNADYCGAGGQSGEQGGCCDGGCQICGTGYRTQCVRTSYNADPTQCCLSNTAVIGNTTCDPKYRGSAAPACQQRMAAYCDSPTNFFSAACKTWLRSAAAGTSGQRDTLALKYCTPGNTDPFCACYSDPMPPSFIGDPAKIALFRCLDPKCRAGVTQAAAALQPYGMNCPTSYNSCNITQPEVNALQSTIGALAIKNNCGNVTLDAAGNAIIPGAPTASPSPSGGPAPAPAPASSGMSKTTMGLIGGGIGLLLIIAIIIVAMTMMKKKPGVAVTK